METTTYECDSLPRAAYFIINGFEPVGSKKVGDHRLVWLFEWSEQLEELNQAYFEGTGLAGTLKSFMRARGRLMDQAMRER